MCRGRSVVAMPPQGFLSDNTYFALFCADSYSLRDASPSRFISSAIFSFCLSLDMYASSFSSSVGGGGRTLGDGDTAAEEGALCAQPICAIWRRRGRCGKQLQQHKKARGCCFYVVCVGKSFIAHHFVGRGCLVAISMAQHLRAVKDEINELFSTMLIDDKLVRLV